jgi:hypothetical protein
MPRPQDDPTYADILRAVGNRRGSEDDDVTKVRFQDMTLWDAWKLTLSFVVAIALGFSLYHWYLCQWPLYRPITALADALIVAGIIGLALEIFATRYLIEKTAIHLADEMTGRGLPPNIKSKISEIATTKLARTKYKKEYSLKDRGDGEITVQTTTTFEVENYGDTTQKYTAEADEEVVFNPRFIYLHYSLNGIQHSFIESELQKTRTDKHGNATTVQVSGKEVKLLPRTKDPTAVCTVKWVIETTMKDEWFDLTEFRYPTENAQIYLAEKPEHIEFHCTGKTNDSKTWTFDEPFMVGQQLKVWWKKKK